MLITESGTWDILSCLALDTEVEEFSWAAMRRRTSMAGLVRQLVQAFLAEERRRMEAEAQAKAAALAPSADGLAMAAPAEETL